MDTTVRTDSPERWHKALARAIAAGVDALEIGGGSGWAVESATRPGLAYLVSGDGRSCTCLAGQEGDPICCHRAVVKFLAGTLSLPREECPTCHGGGHLAVGWGGWAEATVCHDCHGRGAVEMTTRAFVAAHPAPQRAAMKPKRARIVAA